MYTPEFKEQAILKALQRGDKTLQIIADELNINLFTLKEWLRKSRSTMTDNTPRKRPTDWTRAQRFQALMQSSPLNGEALNSFCREQGIFTHHLQTWKAEFIQETSKEEVSRKSTADKALREENEQPGRVCMLFCTPITQHQTHHGGQKSVPALQNHHVTASNR